MDTSDRSHPTNNDSKIAAQSLVNQGEKNLTSTEMAAAVLLAGLLSIHPLSDFQPPTTPSGADAVRTSFNSHQLTGQDPTNQGIPHLKPAEGFITCEFHQGHPGVDFRLLPGSPIWSTMDGEVSFTGWNGSILGNMIVINNGKFSTCYAHLATIQVKAGDWIHSGSNIGTVGANGREGRLYLHYEVRIDGKPENPERFFGKRVNNFPS